MDIEQINEFEDVLSTKDTPLQGAILTHNLMSLVIDQNAQLIEANPDIPEDVKKDAIITLVFEALNEMSEALNELLARSKA